MNKKLMKSNKPLTMKKIGLLILVISISTASFAQFQLFKEYSEATIGYFEFSYRNDISGNFQAHSKYVGFEFGFNVAKGINEKMNIVPFGGIGFGWGAQTKNDFLVDFNRYGVFMDKHDGIIHSMREEGFSGDDGGKSVCFNYGLLFKAPTKYSPMLTLYGKTLKTSVGHSNSVYINEAGSDVGYWRNGIGAGLRIPINRLFYVGAYFDSFNFRKGITDANPGTRMHECLTEDFFDKNGNRENVFGIRFGIQGLMLQ